MLDRPEFVDVLVQGILPHLSNRDLAMVYQINSTLRNRIVLYKNWKRMYRTTFPHDTLELVDSGFEQYIRRCNATIQLWNRGVPHPFPRGEIVVNLVASRFLVACLTLEGHIYIGPHWQRTPGKFERLWAGIDHLFAVGSEGLEMWKFLDLLPTRVEGLPESATLCCSGTSIHACSTPSGVYWWRHTLESRIEPQLLHDSTGGQVTDMLAMKNGLLVLKSHALYYFHQMQEPCWITLPGSPSDYCRLRRVDFHQSKIVVVERNGHEYAMSLRTPPTSSLTRSPLPTLVLGFLLARVREAVARREAVRREAVKKKPLRSVDSCEASAVLVSGLFG